LTSTTISSSSRFRLSIGRTERDQAISESKIHHAVIELCLGVDGNDCCCARLHVGKGAVAFA